jgi:predicted cupin superfamily sugar epimerase
MMDTSLPLIKPVFTLSNNRQEDPSIKSLLDNLNLQPHPEGGYYVETHRAPEQIATPFGSKDSGDNTRSTSTTIFYLLTPAAPLGAFHRNRGRTVHTWHRGRGRYVIIHANEVGRKDNSKARVESFVVGPNHERGERLQWIVDGGNYKASFLLPDSPDHDANEDRTSNGLLISEVVIPGFEFEDHEFLRREEMHKLLTTEQSRELNWMLKSELDKV